MKKLFTLRSIFSLLLLLIAANALVTGLRLSILEVREAAFFPVAAFALTLSYCLGFSTWSARRAWQIVLFLGFILAFLESARLMEPLKVINRAIPAFELRALRSVWEREPVDTSVFQTQFIIIAERTNIFISRLLTGETEHPLLIEFSWDIPLLFFTTWMGWCISRHNQVMLAFAPALIFHAAMLNYTGQDATSIQIAACALIILLGINHTWNRSKERTENTQRVTRETYSAVILTSITFAIIAGITPSISIKEIARKITASDEIAKAAGLKREQVPAGYSISGLPRQHLIGLGAEISQATIFTVKTGELEASDKPFGVGEVPRHYWRWLIYDIYTGQGWESSPVQVNSYSANDALFAVSNVRYQTIHQQVEKTYSQDQRLFWTGMLTKSDQAFNASWRTAPESIAASIDPLLNIDMLGALTEQQQYEVDSLIPVVSANQLRASLEVYPQEIQGKYLQLPASTTQRVIDLAYTLTDGITNPYDKAKAIERYLRNYPYSLEVPVPPSNQDVADYFIFDLQTGYCDYYSTSMIVMARAVGLPARLVIGYANGTYDPVEAQYVVHEADAHSWVEVYFTGTGWVEFEPTANQPEFILPDDFIDESSPIIPFPISASGAQAGTTKKNVAPQSLLPFVMTGVIIICFSCIWILYKQGLFRAHHTVGSMYRYVSYHGKKLYKNSPPYETPLIFADKLSKHLRTGFAWLIPAASEIKLLTDLYIKEAYSPHIITKDEMNIARRVWQKLFWRLVYARMMRL